jgi:hypothetical protein
MLDSHNKLAKSQKYEFFSAGTILQDSGGPDLNGTRPAIPGGQRLTRKDKQ